MFDNKLEALVGLRYFEDERGGTTTNRTVFPAPSPVVVSQSSGTVDAISPRFNLKYNASEDGNIYVNVAKGFRSGVLQTASQAAAATASGVPATSQVDPDSLWTYEVGTKWNLLDKAV
jgi:iron complex outermembrane receptor protein